MTDPLGLSVGTIGLVAVRAGRPPVARHSVLTLFDGQQPEVGVPGENPDRTGPGLSVRGFVERVGYPVPLTLADGSRHRGEDLTADALDTLAGLAGHGTPVVIAVPAHWGPGPLGALRTALRAKPALAPDGVPPVLISDVAAAVAALTAGPGLPRHGVVALCDFGGSGTSITLLDAAADFAPTGPTVRYGGFSGEQVDQAVLSHLLSRVRDVGGDPAGITAIESLAALRAECRAAKERLSDQATTAIPVVLPGFDGEISLSRGELEDIVAAPLSGVVAAVSDTLARSERPAGGLAAVALVGGGAAMPAVGARLSREFGVPVITAPQPGFAAAMGAAAWATRGKSAGTRALAWSQDDSKAGEPVPYSEADYRFAGAGSKVGKLSTPPTELPVDPEPPAWFKRPMVLFVLAAALAVTLTGGLAYTLTGSHNPTGHPTDNAPAATTTTATTTKTAPSTTTPSTTTTGTTRPTPPIRPARPTTRR
ncbi:MAG: Hsp70 family protein [Mycobacterium sp.]